MVDILTYVLDNDNMRIAAPYDGMQLPLSQLYLITTY